MMTAALLLCCTTTLGSPPNAIERVELPGGYCWLARPAGFDPQTSYPLIVCLHGTETRAEDILQFWLSLRATLPFIFVAPQGVDAGWRDADLELTEQLRGHLAQTCSYDPQRVLLTGHSAGGAMAFHLLYAEGFEATAIAVTANYVPPTVTDAMVAARCDVPVFYAVGEADLNRPRMRDGLYLLRGAGAHVTVSRPPIGHVLSPEIGQAALTWFESVCRQTTRERIDAARLDVDTHDCLGPAAEALEDLLRNRRAHFAEQVALAGDLLRELQRPGRDLLARAELQLQQQQPLAARELLMTVERRYRPSSLAAEAADRRHQVDKLPAVVQHLAVEQRAADEQAAANLWQASLAALAEDDLKAAESYSRSLLDLYPDSDVADDARNLLNEIEAVTGVKQP